MGDTLLRYLMLLREIPVAPRSVQATELARRLEAQGIAVTVRTVQRDLARLSRLLPLVCIETSKPFAWSFAEPHSEIFPQLQVRPPRTNSGHRINLVARFSTPAATRVAWARLGSERELRCEGDTMRVEVSLPDTVELREWLLSFGDSVEVLTPVSLRRDLLQRARRIVSLYESSAPPPRRRQA